MEKIKKGKSVATTQETPMKCSLSKETEEILAAGLEARLTLKNTNGLLNGLTSEDIQKCKHESKFDKLTAKLAANDNKETENCLKKNDDEKLTTEATNGRTEPSPPSTTPLESNPSLPPIEYVQYESELQMPMIMKIIQKDLSEPYSIYTYRYFIHNWPKLCFLAMCKGECVGAIVCKLDLHRKVIRRGYIAMLAVDENHRKRSIGSTLVRRAIEEMIAGDADEVVLETEVTNKPALRLYEALGFVRDKRLFRYYLNGVDALRLKLWLR